MILEKLFIPGGSTGLADPGAKERAVLTATIESVLLPSIGLAISVMLRNQDPFFLFASFPWIWLAPVLVALRYGSFAALVASLTLVAGWSLAGGLGVHLPPQFPYANFLGGFMTSIICGEFRDLWQAENRRQKLARQHLASRYEELNAAHQALAQSHDQLSGDFIQHAPTLRDALAELPKPKNGRLDAEAGTALLAFLARHFHLEVAALHLMEAGGLRAAPVASLGHARRLNGGESLIAACMRQRVLCHVAEDRDSTGPYLIAAPLLPSAPGDAEGDPLIAVLAVESMAFFAFEGENLQRLAALLGYYTDTLVASTLAAPILSKISDCPQDFAAECMRLQRIASESGLPSALACRIAHPLQPDSALPTGAIRTLDRSWTRPLAGTPANPMRKAQIFLLPFCNEAQAHQALNRLYPWPGRDTIAVFSPSPLPMRDRAAVQVLSDFLDAVQRAAKELSA